MAPACSVCSNFFKVKFEFSQTLTIIFDIAAPQRDFKKIIHLKEPLIQVMRISAGQLEVNQLREYYAFLLCMIDKK